MNHHHHHHHPRGTTTATTTTTTSSGTGGGGSTGTRFRGELHVLCEEARWDEVTRKLKVLLQPPPSSAGGAGHGPSATTSGGGPNPYGLGGPQPQSHAFRTAPQAHFSSAVSELSLDTTFADMSSVVTPPPAVAARQAVTRERERLAAELLRREGPNEWTPLMISCARAPPDVLAVLVAASPGSCLVPDRSGGLPIHFVSGWRRSWWGGSSAPPTEHSLTTGTNPDLPPGLSQAPLNHSHHSHSQQANPRASATANNSYRGTDDGDDEDEMKEFCDALRILLAAAPDSVKYRNRWGQTPLHAAFDGGIVPSTDAIRVLLGMDPQDEFLATAGIRMDRRGSARLSQIEGAIDENQHEGGGEDGVGDETLSSITKPPTVIGPGVGMTTSVSTHVRDALATADARGRLPLHVAAERGSSNEILNLLVNKYRAAAWTPTHRGNLPVHSLHYYAKKTLSTSGAAAAPKPGLPGTPSSATAIGSIQNDADTVEGSSGSKSRVVDAEAMEVLLRPISDADQFRPDDDDDDDDDDQPEGDENDVNGKQQQQQQQQQQHSLDVSSFFSPVEIPSSHAQALNWMGETVDSSWAGRQPTHASSSTAAATTPIPPTTLFPAIADAVLRRRSGGNKRNRLRPREAAMVACRIPGAQKAIHLPLHLAAEYGVSFSVLEGLCNLFPAAVALPHPQLVKTPPPADVAPSGGPALQDSVKVMYPIELFETGLAGAAALAALQSQKRLAAMAGAEDVSLSLQRLGEIMRQFVDRSDLLFSFFPLAVPSQYGKRPLPPGANGSRRQRKVVKLYRRDPDRLVRLEKMIRSQALDVSRKELTPVALRIWSFMCRYFANETDKRDAYRTHVGRVISGLHDDALWKLSFTVSATGQQELIVLASGKTIKNEATERAPKATMDGDLLGIKSWQAVLNSFLSSVDALSWSAACRRSRAAGVRLVATEMDLRQSSGYWEFPPYDNSNTSYRWWQRIEPVVSPAITHSVIVGFRLELQYSRQAIQQHPRGFRPGTDGGGGGLVVVCDGIDPSGNSIPVVVSEQVAPSTTAPSSLVTNVKLAYRHLPGQSYSLWHFGPHVGGRVAVSGIRLRQLLLGPDPRAAMSRSNSPVFSGTDHKSLFLMRKQQPQQPQPQQPPHSLHAQQPLPLHPPHGVGSVTQSRSTAASPGHKRGGPVGESRLHHALRAGFAEDALAKLIASKPAILMETDEEGLTPLHAAFLLESDEPPSFSIVRTLLSTPGENAAKLKDSYGRLPLHIAAERGAGENILTLLVTAYADACYRQNKDGDLPVHLLVRSGAATTATVELLLKPIMRSETICRLGGSQGVMLPLHIAAEYRCSFNVLERLLQTYGEAASQPRVLKHEDDEDDDDDEDGGGGSSKKSRKGRSSGNDDDDEDDDEEGSQVTSVPLYALDIFELQRDRVLGRENSVQRAMTRGNPSRREMREQGPLSDMVGAEYNLRSDLLFVYNPFLIAPLTDTPYRRDEGRIERLLRLIRREALVAAETYKGDESGAVAAAELSDVAKLAWCFFCTFMSAVNAKDHYTRIVRRILRGLPTAAAHVLACVPNPHSNYQPLSVSATPQCVQLILSRSRFVGRYAFWEDEFPLFMSDSTLVLRARDYGAVPEFERLKGLLLAEKEEVDIDLEEDDTKSNDGTATTLTGNTDDRLMTAFLAFARYLGVGEDEAKAELRSHVVEGIGMDGVVGLEHSRGGEFEELGRIDEDDEDGYARSRSSLLSLETFLAFCKACRLDDSGVRHVIIKLLTDRIQYQWELRGRSRLRLDDTEWPVVPVWAHYDAERAARAEKEDRYADDGDKDEEEDPNVLFARDVHEGSFSSQNLSLFRFALVMPCHDSDLFQLSIRQELDILRIRDFMLQVARSVKALHAEHMIHGNLHMGNIVCFGGSVALTELGCSRSIPGRGLGSNGRKEYVGGASCGTRTASVPPEMITRIEQGAGYRELSQLEQYWKAVSDDAKDLKLLTPDDIHTITAVVTSLLGQWRTLEASTSSAGSSSSLFSTGGPKSRATRESAQKAVQDWKEELSGALVTISFEDLPSSLTCCQTLEQFGSVWERLRENAKLWEKVKPRFFSSSGYAYVLKTFDDREGGAAPVAPVAPGVQGLPYEPVIPNEKVDVWAFGVLLYSLCSGSNLFHVGYHDDLRDAASFAALYGWSRKKAQAIIFDNVADPLAQDLLLHLLVPEADRLENMDMVLQHPFFGPFSSADAQRILEKHEEQQLIMEETVVISIMTAKTQRKLQRSTEARCKVIFQEDKIVIPTAFVVLPYELHWDPAAAAFVIPSEPAVFGMASEVGRYLLQINKATARLSFWTTMKKRLSKKNGGDFKSKMKGWLTRARSDTSDVVARDMLESIGCASEYTGLCVEMLEKSESVSSARAYIKDPMAAAYKAIKDATDKLVQLYRKNFFYLVDEYQGVPVLSRLGGEEAAPYPVKIDPGAAFAFLQHLFLPFMHICVMSLTSDEGLMGLARVLGIPRSHGIPDSWTELGLVHRAGNTSTIEEFGIWQKKLRRYDPKAHKAAQKAAAAANGGGDGLLDEDALDTESGGGGGGGMGSGDSVEHGAGSTEMRDLEVFFREFDPMRLFCDLRRVTDGNENSPAMWTTVEMVSLIQGEMEMASVEARLEELRGEMARRDTLADEMARLSAKYKAMRQSGSVASAASAAGASAAAAASLVDRTDSHSAASLEAQQLQHEQLFPFHSAGGGGGNSIYGGGGGDYVYPSPGGVSSSSSSPPESRGADRRKRRWRSRIRPFFN